MRLFDCHAHTCDLSYCCDAGITVDTYVDALRRSADCSGVAITNHGFAIYFPHDLAWSWEYMERPSIWDDHREWGNRRLAAHLDMIDAVGGEGVFSGIEVELMSDGRLTLDDRFRDRLDVVIGSVHVMPEQFQRRQPPPAALFESWWDHTQRLAAAGIDLLGHPFRWLAGRDGIRVAPQHVRDLVLLAKRHRVALEVNSHQVVETDLDMLKLCAEEDVAIAFGTDSHRREEILDLGYHRALLARAGLSAGDLTLWLPHAA